MRDLLRACSAEILKLKRTLALWVAVLSPLLVILLQCAFTLRVPKSRLKAGLWAAVQQGSNFWAVLLLPLVACLLTALLAGLEHRENSWKQVFALPVPRWAVYGAKAVAAHALIALGSTVLYGGIIASGYALHMMLPQAPFGPAPWTELAGRLALVFAASSALIAIHLWVATRCKAFPFPLGLGIGAVLVSIIAASDKTMTYWPWMFPGNTAVPERFAAALWLGLGGGIAITALGAWDTVRRDIL